MPFRKTVFWIHLPVGVIAGFVILMMSVTGVLLTYQKQMTEWADREYWVQPAVEGQRALASDFVAGVRAYDAEAHVGRIIVYSGLEAPVAADLGDGRILYMDPSTAEIRGEGAPGMRAFFSGVVRWHRWFNFTGEGRANARAITGWSNVAFLFLVISGLYMWFPRRFKWQHIRPTLLLDLKAKRKARDFNWHNVFGFWMSIPLAIVVASATVISFPWASDLAYRVTGEAPPPRRTASVASQVTTVATPDASPAAFEATMLNAPVEAALTRVEGWRTITVDVPDAAEAPLQIRVDRGWGGEPQKRHTLTFDAATGGETSYATFQDQSPGRRLRTTLRFAHTGEYFGRWGQTLAGLASLAGVLLVWSGLALAWRRLARPLLDRVGDGAILIGTLRGWYSRLRGLWFPEPVFNGPELRLVDIALGERVSLVRIDMPQAEIEPLLERGILPGCDLCPIRRSPSGDPIIEVDGSVLAVRYEVAACLCVVRSGQRARGS